ncbi:hypothetical protein LINPERHAP2_LOCUS29069 [Linum perenne]
MRLTTRYRILRAELITIEI